MSRIEGKGSKFEGLTGGRKPNKFMGVGKPMGNQNLRAQQGRASSRRGV